MSSVTSEFDRAVAYSLSRLGKPDLELRPEQKAFIRHVYEGKDVFVWLSTEIGRV